MYLWRRIEDAKRWHGDDYRRRVVETYGSEPSFTYFETPLVVDNAAGKVSEAAAEAA